jgi:Fe-S-cluster containining protein
LFSRDELDTAGCGGTVPAELTEPYGARAMAMRGTIAAPQRCVALTGTIGQQVGCAIYDRRPSSCRDFAPLAGLGQGEPRCGDARRRHGLLPLAGSYDSFILG